MNLRKTIAEDTTRSLRAKDERRLVTLRMLSSAIHNREIDKRGKGEVGEITEEDILGVLRSEAKKRRDAIAEFEKGGRPDLVEKEKQELVILEAYLPAQLDDAAIAATIRSVVAEFGSVGAKDFGRVMGEVMKRLEGRASGDRVSRAVAAVLG
ncbi:MAG: hypothetical protein A2131_00310 [Candidatus Sungbacteria bacterium GWC2_49_10]|uniref:GatB/YqeY domain-containing protein n=2 Tax=Parcubacteria group TaxID=1794811 RepID=A0A0G1Z2U7_9BACT|nr:MAG: hypothetical protein UY60_C0006G0009 [Parcubacteria group bacterium GW2011_GWB1_50_9]KKW21692.1 MAG: hypothetical protein UY61_C0001G0007 [Candidatus Adlerbacteria bacterium GW2011_GWC1_50_9]KKW33722.1 MAG: hypothetical protein UY78_C0004G0007 [Parcubacteria group bacterium GW2011_GWA1_53_13]OGZ94707.1 MAG: hypothetical protein A2131_00310 [Candidatus Sungbacteria bacterium GWC2_49_10]